MHIIKDKGVTMVVRINQEVYSKDIVLKTCFIFIEDYYFQIDIEDNYWVVIIESKDHDSHRDIVNEFWNELLEQQCRTIVSSKTKNIRELILTRALYSSYIEQEELSDEDSDEDSDEEYELDSIARDWFEYD